MSTFLPTEYLVNEYLFNKLYINKIEDDFYTKNSYPIVYIIFDLNTNIAYVGESTSAISRMNNHLSHPVKSKLKYVYIISSSKFNKSATLDIESNLIKYMVGDGTFKLLNGNAGIVDHNYYQKAQYYDLFKNIWKNLKLKNVVTKDILEINNSDLFKYSPYKSLSIDQHRAVQEFLNILLNSDSSTTFVEGSAGTGKTIIAIYLIKLLITKFDIDDYDELEGETLKELTLVKDLQKHDKELSIALVIPVVSLRKTLQNVFRKIKGLTPSMVIGPADTVGNHYDILIVDEAHRLKRRRNITNYRSFDNSNASLGLGNNGTELDWVLKSSEHQIFFYDEAQSIRPSDIDKEVFITLKNASETNIVKLTSQMRSQGGNDYILFIDALLNTTINVGRPMFNNSNYEVKVFDYLPDMMAKLNANESKYGLCRLIAGYGWKWVSKKLSGTPDATIDGVNLYWNRVPHDWINSTSDLNEMGCIHTTQGYDLNYAGIIFGNEIKYNPVTKEIEVDKSNYFDSKGSAGIENIETLKEYIINIYKTIMYRGIKGTYIYVCDVHLREYFQNYIETN
jgi:hypothetical protein